MSKFEEGQVARNTNTISLDAFCAPDNETIDSGASSLRVMSVGRDAAYVGLFTKEGIPVTAHYLEDAHDWSSGYVRCLGEDCPACKTGLQQNRFLLLPVLDRITGTVALLRVSAVKGPGKLATELGKVLAQPDMDQMIAKITRDGRYNFSVTVLPTGEHDPEAIRAVQSFKEQVDSGLVNLTASVTEVSAEEMAEHPHIAKTLKLEGL